MVDSVWTQCADICTDQLRIGPGEGLVRRCRSVVCGQPIIEIDGRGATVGRSYSIERRCRTSDGVGVVSDCRRRRTGRLRLEIKIARETARASAVTRLHVPTELMAGSEAGNHSRGYISDRRIAVNQRVACQVTHKKSIIRGTARLVPLKRLARARDSRPGARTAPGTNESWSERRSKIQESSACIAGNSRIPINIRP